MRRSGSAVIVVLLVVIIVVLVIAGVWYYETRFSTPTVSPTTSSVPLVPSSTQKLGSGTCIVSSNNEHIACLEASPSGALKERYVVDGIPQQWYQNSTYYPIASNAAISSDGSHLVYDVRQGDRWAFVLDGKESASTYSSISTNWFGPDDELYFLAYTSSSPHDNNQYMVANGQNGPVFSNIYNFIRFSPDGKHFAYVGELGGYYVIYDGKKFGPYSGQPVALTFSPDGNNFAYVAATSSASFIVLNGQILNTPITPAYTYNASIAFNPMNDQLAYVANNGAMYAIVNKDEPGASSKGPILDPTFSPDGKTLAYVAEDSNSTYLVINGVDQQKYQWSNQQNIGDAGLGDIIFSADSQHIAYAVSRVSGVFIDSVAFSCDVVVDEKVIGSFSTGYGCDGFNGFFTSADQFVYTMGIFDSGASQMIGFNGSGANLYADGKRSTTYEAIENLQYSSTTNSVDYLGVMESLESTGANYSYYHVTQPL